MTIAKKATVGFGAILLVTFVLGYDSLTLIRSLGQDLDNAVNSTGKAVEQIGRVTTALSDMKAAAADFILYSSLNDLEKSGTARKGFQEAAGRMAMAMGEARPALRASASLDSLDTLARGHNALTGHFRHMTELCASLKCNEALLVHSQKILPLAEEMSRIAMELSETQRKRLAEAAESAGTRRSVNLWISGFLIAVAAVIGFGVFMVLQQINGILRDFARRMAQAARQMSGAAREVSSSSAELADGSLRQASSLEETSATTEQLAVMTKRNAESARATFEVVLRGDQRVEEANRALQRMETSMDEINRSSNKISKIIKVIEEIAFQTNILALNAAVEAARAGETGLGFAVVAEEVRHLAQRCSQAARDTTDLIEESIQRSGEGGSNLQQVSRAITAITDASSQIRTLVDEVNLGSQEQAKGIEYVSHAVTQMSDVTQRSAKNSEKGAAAGKQMEAQAELMNDMVVELRSMVGAGE